MSVSDFPFASIFFGSRVGAVAGLCRSRRAFADGLPRSKSRVVAFPGAADSPPRLDEVCPGENAPPQRQCAADVPLVARRRTGRRSG